MDVLQRVSQAVLAKPLTIEVDVIAKSPLQKKLQQYKLSPIKKTFEVHPITLGSLIRISELLLSINISEEDIKGKWQETSYRLMRDHSKTIAQIVAVAIVNGKNEPNKKLIDFILYNFTAKELMSVLSVVVNQMGITDFITSIVSVRAMNVLEQKKPAPAKIAKKKEASL